MEAASFFRSEVAERSGANRAEGKDIANSPTRAAAKSLGEGIAQNNRQNMEKYFSPAFLPTPRPTKKVMPQVHPWRPYFSPAKPALALIQFS